MANVISIKETIDTIKIPKYYEELEVEYWFVFDDLRLIAYRDFETIRDKILSNFKATNFNDRTYAIYGNPYVYPMQVTMKEEIDYFDKEDENFKFYVNIFKSTEQLNMKQNLIDFNFGEKIFYNLTPNTQDNIINAEIEYMKHRDNPLYDFSSVVVNYSKAVEIELFSFMKKVFAYLLSLDDELENFPYTVQGKDYKLKDILLNKPNFGTYLYIFQSKEIKTIIHTKVQNGFLKYFIFSTLPYFLKTMQKVRNESVHGDAIPLKDCNKIRTEVIGIGKNGIICEFDKVGEFV